MSRPRHIAESLFIDAPLEQVWNLYDDPAEVARWAPGMIAGEVEGGGPKRLGSRLRWTMKTAGKETRLTEEVVEYEPPRKSVLRGSSFGMGYDMVLELTPERGGTLCRYTCVATYRGLMRLLAPLADALNRKMLRDALFKLRVVAESARPAAG